MRRRVFSLALLLASAAGPFACSDERTGSGGLPGDNPRVVVDAGRETSDGTDAADSAVTTDAPSDGPSSDG